jgi:hypothetical protein
MLALTVMRAALRAASLDHLVGEREQLGRDINAERSRAESLAVRSG